MQAKRFIYSIVLSGVIITAVAYFYFRDTSSKIAFVTNRDGNNEIYLMNTDGSSQKNLTNNAASDQDPSWSHDGKHIVFASTRDGNSEIYIMDIDGTNQKRLTNNDVPDFLPAWSPIGNQIAFVSVRDLHTEIFVMNIDGSDQINLTQNAVKNPYVWTPNISPAWSPDGSVIAFASLREGAHDIYLMFPDGSNSMKVTTNHGYNFSPQWTIDGSQIIFDAKIGRSNREIFMLNIDNSELKRLTFRNYTRDISPSLSPDGKKLVFESNMSILYIMNLDGTDQRPLMDRRKNRSRNFSPSWSPYLR